MIWLGMALGLLAAVSNAGASVLQRVANRDEAADRRFSFRLVIDLIRKPVWLGGVACMTASFFLQSAGLGLASLAAVEPLLVLELPIALLAAGLWLGGPLGRQTMVGVVGMTAGTVALIALLHPTRGNTSVPLHDYLIGMAVTGAAVAACYAYGMVTHSDHRRAAVLGVGAGAAFGLTAALLKGMTEQYGSGGISGVFGSWQLYGAIAVGVLAVWMQQNAVGSARLVFAQPGITLSDPYVSIAWGAVIFHEQMRSGIWILPEACAGALMAASAIVLSRAHATTTDDEPEQSGSKALIPQDA